MVGEWSTQTGNNPESHKLNGEVLCNAETGKVL